MTTPRFEEVLALHGAKLVNGRTLGEFAERAEARAATFDEAQKADVEQVRGYVLASLGITVEQAEAMRDELRLRIARVAQETDKT